MPATNLADADAALAAALQPLRDVMAAIETEITERETQLIALRKRRTETGRALAALDPQWAAEHGRVKPGPRAKGASGKEKWSISDERVAEAIERLRASFDGRAFNATEAQPVIGLHITSVHKLFRRLHDRGQLQLDHLGGQRKTTRYYTLSPNPEGGTDGD